MRSLWLTVVIAALPVAGAGVSSSSDGIGGRWIGISATSAHAQTRLRNLLERLKGDTMPPGIVKTNGRLEATEVDVSAKYPGKLADITIDEGSNVTEGEVVGRVLSPEYDAQLKEAQSNVEKAKQSLIEAQALVAQKNSVLELAKTNLERGEELINKRVISQLDFDQRKRNFEAEQASTEGAMAQEQQAEASIKAQQAEVERIKAILNDMVLVSPRTGRVQYLLARSGEVVGADGKVMTVIDLKDIYMTVFLPAASVGRLALGGEARVILDPVPQYVIPATVTFVASDAQFTPKTVETADERQKLMFRVKLKIDAKVLEKYYSRMKTGCGAWALCGPTRTSVGLTASRSNCRNSERCDHLGRARHA
jgi:HlyD family secretion protein